MLLAILFLAACFVFGYSIIYDGWERVAAFVLLALAAGLGIFKVNAGNI